MAETISDDFAIANGIAAYALVRELLVYLETLGVPRQQIVGITMTAHQTVKHLGNLKTHAAMPIAAELLSDAVRQLEATTSAKH